MSQANGKSWREAAESQGGEKAPRIPAGPHNLVVSKVIYTDKSGTPFKSSKGDPQILVVVSDAQGREAAEMFTLSEAAKFKIAKLLMAAGANLDKMQAAGITPQHFADQNFSNKNLVGRKFYGEIGYRNGDDGKEYGEINAIPQQPAHQTPAQATPAPQQKPTPAPAQTAPAFNPESNIDPADIPF